MQFRKKPIVIDAITVIEALKHAAADWPTLPTWLRDAYERGTVTFASDAIHINTLEGQMCGNKGDLIIRGVQGELYPCKAEIFAATYDAVIEGPPPPGMTYEEAWGVLSGYVMAAASNPTPNDAAEIQGYMRELDQQRLAPIADWIRSKSEA